MSPREILALARAKSAIMFGQYKRLKNEFTGVIDREIPGIWRKPDPQGSHRLRVRLLYGTSDESQGRFYQRQSVRCFGFGETLPNMRVEKIIQLGGRVVTLSDSSGFIHDPDGINKEKLAYLIDLKTVRRGRIKEYADKYKCKFVEGKKTWGIKCDLAFPCATENEIDEAAARKMVKNGLQALAEGANMPTTREAIRVFLDAKIPFAPGKAANAGGVAISGLEMTQNSIRLSWSRDELEERLKDIMASIHKQCVAYGVEKEGNYINYVKGANIGGFVKVADAMLAYGVI